MVVPGGSPLAPASWGDLLIAVAFVVFLLFVAALVDISRKIRVMKSAGLGR